MYSTGNESKVVVAERFVRTLKDKIYKETTVDDSLSSFLNKLVDDYNNNYHHYFGKKPVHANYSALTEESEADLKAC